MILKTMTFQTNWLVKNVKLFCKTNVILTFFFFINFQCNQFFVELYEVYWLCLKNYSNFSTLDLTKLLFLQLPSMKNEFGKSIFTINNYICIKKYNISCNKVETMHQHFLINHTHCN